jgi:penicillin amidase
VIWKGQEVPLETIEERIADGAGGEVIYPVKVVPHHGPIVPTIVGGQVQDPDPAVGALSVRWTGFEPTADLDAVTGLMLARDVDEAREALDAFEVGSQNWMIADTSGNILWSTHSRVPYRDDAALAWDAESATGLLPCLVLPGDGTAEWTGYWADDAVPWRKNPAAGYIATANNDQVGGSLDNDPSNDLQPDGKSGYLACSFDPGFRQGRIQQRIESHDGLLDLDALSSIQGDHHSPLGERLVPGLLLAIGNAELQRTGAASFPDLAEVVADPAYDPELVATVIELLEAWRSEHDYAAESGIAHDDNQPLVASQPEAQAARATLLFNVWLVRFLGRVFNDELARTGRPSGTGHTIAAVLHILEADPPSLATYDAATGDSALFDDLDTPASESRQERMVRALLDAFAWLEDNAGAPDDWRWGSFHTIRFEALAPIFDLAIPSPSDDVFPRGFPRHGDMHNVDACNYGARRPIDGDIDFSYDSGPTQRFVAELTPDGVRTHNALPGGAVWDKSSPHFADQAELWRRNATHPVPFYLPDVLAAAETRAILRPR